MLQAKADPKRPYKLYAGMASAMLGVLLMYADILPIWVMIIVNMAIVGLSVYMTPNPTIVTGEVTDEEYPRLF